MIGAVYRLFKGEATLRDKWKLIIAFLSSTTAIVVTTVALAVSMIFMSLGANSTTENTGTIGTANINEAVMRWKPEVESAAQKWGIPEKVDWILAIMMVETGGSRPDIMQSSESKGLPMNTINNEIESIDAGVEHLAKTIRLTRELELDDETALAAYNFGVAYVSFVARHGGKHSLELAEVYSRTVVAPSLGNTTGATYSYVNAVSIKHGKTYLYWNGGNYFYVELLRQYLVQGNLDGLDPLDFYDEMKAEMEKYSGMEYVWGGKNPQMGFDCSGLTAYLYSLFGIHIDSYTVSQWNQSVPVSIKEARAGDLIFFKGTYGASDFISHVGIYVNETTMFDANSSGVGYHTWNTGYWAQHQPSIRRVIQN